MFKFIQRGKEKTIVLLPGWATDWRIFERLDLDYNYILTDDLLYLYKENNLIEVLKEQDLSSVSFFGWSLGGFWAADFASRYDRLVDELILVGVCKTYNQKKIEKVKELLIKNKRAYLYKFYKQCFYPSKYSWFKEHLQEKYLSGIGLSVLLETLDYLACNPIIPSNLKSIKKIKIIHGENDPIAPIAEARQIKEEIPWAEFICVKNQGHFPFFQTEKPKKNKNLKKT
ncbi:MAG: alpha/beta hydrolase [bacterium]